MRHLAANVLTVLLVALVGLVLAVGTAERDFAAPGPAEAPTLVRIEAGSTADGAVAALDAAGVLRQRAVGGLLTGAGLLRMRLRTSGAVVKRGEYEVPARASLADVMELVTSGRSIQYPITIPEGWTSWQVVEHLRAEPVLAGEIAEIPAEGSIAPDTYNVERGTERAALIARMQAAQTAILEAAWESRAEGLPLDTPGEALILASIVEKETGLPEERPQVASVFVNRLRRGMRLETDPTVVYGAIGGQGALDRPPTGPELRQITDWNTYRIDGLPKTPIANPGRAAIEAVLNPVDTPYLFFVADGTGGHAFAETLTEHNRNVRAWRQIERERREAGSE